MPPSCRNNKINLAFADQKKKNKEEKKKNLRPSKILF